MYNGATMEPISFAAGLFTMWWVWFAAAATTHTIAEAQTKAQTKAIHTYNEIDAAAEDMKIGLGIKMDTDDDNDDNNDDDNDDDNMLGDNDDNMLGVECERNNV
jgi:hypothetical protein